MNSKKIEKMTKKKLKENNLFKEYKNSFKVRKLLFLLTKINSIFSKNINFESNCENEIMLFQNIKDVEKWSLAFNNISLNFDNDFKKCDWKSFGSFLFYVWNQYLFNIKKYRKFSIYTFDNFNEINAIKTSNYNKWIETMQKTNKDFNLYIRKVLKIVL